MSDDATKLRVQLIDPATNGNGAYHVYSCPDHPDATTFEESRKYHDCNCSWSCKHPSFTIVERCAAEGCERRARTAF